MKLYTNNIGLIAQAKNIRMGLSYAKVSHASFLSRYVPDCPIRLKEVCYIEKGQTITEDDVLPGSIPVVAGGKHLPITIMLATGMGMSLPLVHQEQVLGL